MAPNFQIERVLCTLGGKDTSLPKIAALVSWGGRPPKIDVRTWIIEGEDRRPGKGITLTDSEAAALRDALDAYLPIPGCMTD